MSSITSRVAMQDRIGQREGDLYRQAQQALSDGGNSLGQTSAALPWQQKQLTELQGEQRRHTQERQRQQQQQQQQQQHSEAREADQRAEAAERNRKDAAARQVCGGFADPFAEVRRLHLHQGRRKGPCQMCQVAADPI